MKSLSKLAAATLLVTATGAASAGSFSYNYVEGSFGEIDVLGPANDGDVIYLGGSHELDPKFGLLGSVGIADYPGGADGTILRFGGFFHTPLQSKLDLIATLELAYSDWDGPGDSDDLGIIASGGLRYAVQDNFQVEGKLSMTEVDPLEDGIGLQVAARYYLSREFSAAAGVGVDSDFDGLFINLRYDLK